MIHIDLIVLCYDDRNIELNGKKVVGPTGGTFGPRIECVRRSVLTFRGGDGQSAIFGITPGLDGRIHFYVLRIRRTRFSTGVGW